ncbi:MAG: RNA polymerase sigma factor [Acidobacteria bacterium]|nr:RNA polymerase sigma factor [Acidobacteriota bacterium]
MAESNALFLACHQGLVKYLTGAVGNADTARDLAQDVFVRVAAANALPTTEEGRRAWVFHIARNIAIDHHRRQKLRQVEPITIEPVVSAGGSADTALIVNQALAALDDLARDVFLMREVAGLSYTEIADACNLTPNAVRSRIHRARLELREYLQQPISAARARPLRAGFPIDRRTNNA